MKLFSLLFLVAGPLCGQLSYGVIAGVPFTDLTNGTAGASAQRADQSGDYTVGPTVQLGLPLGFRVEADALYRPAGFSLGSSATFSSAQWRFPILLQYRLSTPVIKPFVEAGYSYDHLNLQATSSSPGVTSHHGFVLGAGADFKVPFVRISPEIRYTRDVKVGYSILNADQAEFLVGIRF